MKSLKAPLSDFYNEIEILTNSGLHRHFHFVVIEGDFDISLYSLF